jgi:crossover junction endodeoxyribonuclease RuvC
MTHPVRIIGIDPGLRRTGWGIIDVVGNRLSFIAAGTLMVETEGVMGDRLVDLFDQLTGIIESHRPDEAAVEETFVNENPRSTLKLGQARGIALLVPARAGLMVAEYAPNQIKKSVVGAGHAEKQQIRMMVKVLLPKATFDKDDAADALAIAICHAHHRPALARARAIG